MKCYTHKWETKNGRWICSECSAVAESTDMAYKPCELCGKDGRNATGLCADCRKCAQKITEVERAALTLLVSKLPIHDPKVRDYVNHIVADSDFSDYLDHRVDGRNRELYPDDDDAYWFSILDKAAYSLAVEVAFYRRDGRPTGDQTTDIGGGFRITSSLAASIVEFHQSVVEAYCWHAERTEIELRSKLYQIKKAVAF